jgi:hypothetical protein
LEICLGLVAGRLHVLAASGLVLSDALLSRPKITLSGPCGAEQEVGDRNHAARTLLRCTLFAHRGMWPGPQLVELVLRNKGADVRQRGRERRSLAAILGHPLPLMRPTLVADTAVQVRGIGAVLQVVSPDC